MTDAPRRPPALPGDPDWDAQVARMVRVDHAGEYGARRIYDGQLAVLGKTAHAETIRHMRDQETEHLETFDRLVVEREVRPTALHPLWHALGYALGAASAAMGPKAAMAVTVAVEEVIDEHYSKQAEKLAGEDPELHGIVEKFAADEREHRDIGLDHGAREAPGYEPLSAAVKAGSRLAIWLSERI